MTKITETMQTRLTSILTDMIKIRTATDTNFVMQNQNIEQENLKTYFENF